MPELMISRQDPAPGLMPAMSVLINREEIVPYLPDKKQRTISLLPGRHVLQLKCNGMKSRPFVIDVPETESRQLLVAVSQPRSQWWLLVFASCLWVPLLFLRSWWLIISWSLAIIAVNVWIIRKRQDYFEIKELPA